jgi:hypothetical protein
MGKKFLDADTQQELGIMSPEVKARMAAAHAALEGNGGAVDAADEAAPALAPGQTALFNAFDDAVECAKCGGRMVSRRPADVAASLAHEDVAPLFLF